MRTGFRCVVPLGACLLGSCGGPSEPSSEGRLTISVAGLPAGVPARVVVSGPGGYQALVTASTTLRRLDGGTYYFEARYVNGQGQTWLAQPSVDSIDIGDRETGTVGFTYAGGPAATLDLSVADAELVQSTQRPDGSVPMVAQRGALLRVYVVANANNAVQPAVRIRLYQAGTLVDTIDVPAPALWVPTAVNPGSLTSSWNALLPAGRVVAGLEYDVQIDPDDGIPEADKGNNQWPGGNAKRAVAVQSVPDFALRFVPVFQPATGETGDIDNASRVAFITPAQRMFPLGAVAGDVRAPYTSSAPAAVADDANGAWSQILGEMNALRLAENAGRHYMGVISVGYGSGIAGLGYIGIKAAVTWDNAGSAPGVVAHELGHNFGRLHAPCGNPGGVDVSFPHAGGSIGTWGLDLEAMLLKDPAVYRDLMGYCNPDWISDYNYLAVLSYRAANPVRLPTAPEDGLLVWGRIQDGQIIIEPAIAVRAPPSLPERPGPHQLQGLDAAGGRLFSLSFEGDLVADRERGEERHFTFVVPLTAPERGRLSSLRLTAAGLTQLRAIPAALRAAPRAPPMVSIRRAGGVAAVRWDPAYPMAVVRDQATGGILSLARGGSASILAERAAVTVQLSDGVTGGVIRQGP